MALTSQFKKGSDDYLVEQADYCIGDLVVEKKHLYKAYNYYNGKRDFYQYEHLEDNKGLGNPTSMSFTPLIRKHIDAIVGEFLATEIRPKISCKDQKTLSNIFRDKQLEHTKKLTDWLTKFLENSIYDALNQTEQKDKKVQDQEIQREIQNIKEDLDLNYISNYEIAGQNIIQHILQSRTFDFKNKLHQIFLDMLIAGESYYRVIPTSKNTNFRIEVEDPMNTFVDKDPKSKYIKNSYRSVIRRWMTREEIIIKYGNEMSNDDIRDLSDVKPDQYDYNNRNFILIRSLCSRNSGIINDVGAYPEDRYEDFNNWDLIPVYEVEWIDWEKNKNGEIVGKRYQVIRIGADMYILRGEDKNAVRDIDDPHHINISLNGMYYTDGHGAPYSLMLATANLQD